MRVLGQEVWGLQDASGGRALELKAVHLFSNLNGKPRQFWGRDWSHKPPHGFMQGELPERSDSTTAVSFAEERDGGGGGGGQIFPALLQEDEQSVCLMSWPCLLWKRRTQLWVILLVREEGSVILHI